MIDEIAEAVIAYKVKYGRYVALQVTMHPRVYQDCMREGYEKVTSYFNLNLRKEDYTFMGYSLVLNANIESYKVETPRIYHD